MFGINELWLFIVSGIILNILPGPDSLYIIGRTATQGFRAGSAALKELESARIKMDGVIKKFSSELTSKVLSSSLSYNNTKGEPFSKNLGHLIQHFFNHQTHHRGQVSTLINQVGIDIGVTDLLIGIPNA